MLAVRQYLRKVVKIMKKLIYSKEDLELILSLETQEKDKEIEKLNNRIDKAIEYIDSEAKSLVAGFGLKKCINTYKLLDILKGEDNE